MTPTHRLTRISVIAALFIAVGALTVSASPRYAIIPTPAEYTVGEGTYRMKSADAKRMARRLTDKQLAPEAYRLEVTPSGVTIAAADDAGYYYGLMTLEQIISQAEDGNISSLVINDAPRYGYRGFMIDVVRCYFPVDEIKKMIDVASKLKINNVHLHLSDDNGWRMEIKKYPKLTSVGAWRVDRPEIFPGRLNARSADEAATYGGYYTQKELKEIVKYAEKRHVNVIPEIEMPAHAAAAIASYPELACPVVDKFVGVFPGIGGKDASIIMCAGNDDVYTFYQDVLDEVMDVFPSPYIHIGGDEANKAMWEKCPKCNQRMADEGLYDCEELQAYFMDRLNHYVISKGRKTIGWDEVTYGNPKEEMVIMGWQGDGGVAVRDALKSGRKFIMTPARTMYLIRYQGPQWFEPFTYFGNNTLKDIYDFEALSPEYSEKLSDQLLGVQGSLWAEFCRTSADMEYLVFPRLLAVADVAWRQKGNGSWPEFLRGVDAFARTLDEMDITYARSMYNLDHKVTAADGGLTVELSNIRPDMEIRYSVGDKTFSQTYTEPIEVKEDCVVYASTFRDDDKMGRTLMLPLKFNKAAGCSVTSATCTNGLTNRLVNGLRGSERNSDFEWAGWHNTTADFTVDLGCKQHINDITLGALVHSNVCVAAPKTVYFYVSDNGSAFTLVREIELPQEKVFHTSAEVLDLTADHVDADGRYVRVVAVNPGCFPDGMAREGTPSWMYFDEIQVN